MGFFGKGARPDPTAPAWSICDRAAAEDLELRAVRMARTVRTRDQATTACAWLALARWRMRNFPASQSFIRYIERRLRKAWFPSTFPECVGAIEVVELKGRSHDQV